jgi:cytochrome P450
MTSSERPPGPSSSELRGRRREFVDTPTEFLTDLQRTFGDVVYFRTGIRENYLLSHPDHVKDVLVTNHARFHKGPALADGRTLVGENLFTIEDEDHRRHRRLMQPAFQWDRIKGYGEIMVDEAVKMSASFRDGETRDISVDMAHLTLGVAVRALFGTDLPPETRARVTEFVRVLLGGWFGRGGSRRATIEGAEYQRVMEATASIVDELVRTRRDDPAERTDLLSLLLRARDEDGSTFTDREVRDEIAALIAAGHETTSNALTWTWYLLAQNPSAERWMHEQVDAVLGDGDPTVEDHEALDRVSMVFDEALRAIPSIWAIDRSVVADHQVDGYTIPTGAVVFTSPWVTQHDPRWFPEPGRFEPERFEPERRRERPRFSYFPFGGGLRMCVGQPFAVLEAILILAAIGRTWRFRVAPDQAIEMEPLITLRPKHGLRVVVERRTSASR